MIIGEQYPRIEHEPANVIGSLGQQCIDLAAMSGLILDPWQQYLLKQTLSYTEEQIFNPVLQRAQQKWAAFEVGVVVARQNGKGSFLEALELGGLFLFGDRLIIHSAHQFDTSKEAFDRIRVLLESCPDFDSEISKVVFNHGEEGIILKSGQKLRFRTRTAGGGRGFTCDRLILDEAMILSSTQVGALMPTVSARPNPQIVYTGSAGERTSTQLGRVRSRAMDGAAEEPRLYYGEWSINPHSPLCYADCTEHDEPDIPESYAKANPGLGTRITVEHVEAERRSMATEVFERERLSIGDWPVEAEQWVVIAKDEWFDRKDQTSEIITPNFVLAVDTSPDLKYSCIVASGGSERGKTHVEITGRGTTYDYRPGNSWVVARLLELVDEHKPLFVIIDPRSQAGAFIDDMDLYKVPVMSPTTIEHAQACGEFYMDVVPRRGSSSNLVHMSQPGLNAAVAAAAKRDIQNTWMWDKRLSSADITPLVAATLARWGYLKVRNNKPRSAPWAHIQ